MCRIFSNLSPESYAFETKSVRLGGHVTSIRLEVAFWAILEEIAGEQGASLGKFLTRLHDEHLEFHGEPQNFASLLRCACLTYVSEVRGIGAAEARLADEARLAFGAPVPQAARMPYVAVK